MLVESVTAPQAKTLLVVDDDTAIHDLLRRMLANSGWQMDSVENGAEALARLESRSYDLILSDILMPDMDGLALLGHIRERHPDARIVMMTVDNTPDHVLRSLRQEAASYMSKPLFRDTVIATLERALATPVTLGDIRVLSDRPYWISLQVACRLSTADRLTQFMRELPGDLSPGDRERVATAFRELLINAIEHGGHLDPNQTVDLSYIRTARSIVYYIRDPGEGFSFDKLGHAAVGNSPDDPFRHLQVREEMGMRPGGFGLLMTKDFADELFYSAKGNEVIFIKYV